MIDVPGSIVAYLSEQPTLTALTGERIWGERLFPVPGYKPADGGAIVFATRGGTLDYANVLNPRIQFKCYGITPLAANAVYRALYDVLHEAKTGTFAQALCETLGQPLQDERTEWFFVLTYYRFWFLPGV